jgi:protein-arginine kinase activator protein McsA
MVNCAACGSEEAEVLLTWAMVVEGAGERRRTVYYCETCSRENLRSIEAGLEREHW